MRDYYKELSLDSTKSADELQNDLFKQRKKWMQRQNASSVEKQQEAKEMVKLIDEAQEVFDSESAKKAYDEKLKGESSPKSSSTGSSSSSTSYRSGSSSSSSYGSGSSSSSSYGSGSSSSSSSSSGSGSSSSSSSGSSSSGSYSSKSYTPAPKKRGKWKRRIILLILIVIAYTKKDVILDKITSLTASVPGSAVEWNGHYYKLYDNADNWTEAREKCEKKGGHLVTITSAEENDFVYSYMIQEGYTQAFIGLYNASYGDRPVWTWITEEPFEYSYWGSGEPNNDNGGREYYGEFSNGAWNDCLPGSTNQYICEWDSEEAEKQDLEYMEFNGHAYRIYTNADGWKDARERAEKKGGYLACITSAEENAALLKLMRRTGIEAAYFGFYNTGQTENGYTYGWVSGEEAVYTDWAEGQPDNAYNNEIFGGFWEVGGHWNDFAPDALESYIVEWDDPADAR